MKTQPDLELLCELRNRLMRAVEGEKAIGAEDEIEGLMRAVDLLDTLALES